MQRLITTRLISLLFLTMLLGVLAPQGVMAQAVDPNEAYIWPNQGGGATGIGVELPVGGGFEGVQSLWDLGGFGLVGDAVEGFTKSKGAGDLFAVLDVGFTFYELADQSLQQIQDIRSRMEAEHFANWEVSRYKITTNLTSSGVVGADFVGLMVMGFNNDNATTNNAPANIPDLVTIPKPGTSIQSRALPVDKIVFIGPSARISSLGIGSQVKTISLHALDLPACTNFAIGDVNFATNFTSSRSSYFSTMDGVLFNSDQTVLVRYPMGRASGLYYVPSTVTNIADSAFFGCSNLAGLVIRSNVVQIGANAFANSGLKTVYFGGNPPANNGTAFTGNTNCTVYYLPGFTGWGTAGLPVGFGGATGQLYNAFLSFPTNGVRTINYFTGWHNPASDVVLIPSMIDGLPVTSIADLVFSFVSGVTNVVVPDSVTTIGGYAFDHCIDLKSIYLSTNLTSVGEYAFQFCSKLISLNIPNGVTVIPEGLVYHCTKLTTLNIGNKVTSIGYGACNSCERLGYLNIPDSLTSIGATALDYCGRLKVNVDWRNPKYSNDRGGSLFNKTQTELIHGNSIFSGSYTVPDSVVNIDATAFYGASMSTIIIPQGVRFLGADAFANCPNLAGVYFAGNPPSNGAGLFSGSTNAVYRLSNAVGWQSTYSGAEVKLWVTFDYVANNNFATLTSYTGPGGDVAIDGTIGGKTVTSIQAGILGTGPGGKGAITSIILPDSFTSIPDNAFSGLFNLTKIVFGNNVTNIGKNAFQGCASLGNLVLPDTVKSIGEAAFSDCGITNLIIGSGLTSLADDLFANGALKTLTIPGTIQHIGARTFANNSQLEYASIAESVTSLGSNAFSNCVQMTQAFFQGNAPATDGTAFSGDKDTVYDGYVYRSTLVQYLPGTTGWEANYGGVPAQVLPLSYTVRAPGPFETGNGTITITRLPTLAVPLVFPIPRAINGVPVTGIADNAFANNPGLLGVIIPAGITSIGDGPFMNCTNLTNLVVEAGNPAYVSVSNVLFNSALTVLKQYPAGLGGKYQVPSTVTTIGPGAFYGSGIKEATIPVAVTGIGSEAFSFCRGLTNLAVASGNTTYSSIGGVLFNAARTTLVQYPGGLGGIYTIATSVTTIGPSAFAASGIKSVVIPPSISVIPQGALAYCRQLTNITVQSGNANYASVNGVLENASRTALLQYPGGLYGAYKVSYYGGLIPDYAISNNITEIGNLAFAGGSLQSVTVPAGVWNLGSKAFADCPTLGWANFFGNAPSNDGTAFTNSSIVRVFYLASGTGFASRYGGAITKEVPFYVEDNGNNTLRLSGYHGTAPGIFVLPDDIFGKSVSSVGNNAFTSQTNITSLGIPSTVTNIGASAFSGCIRLGSLVLRNSGSLSVGHDAFAGCLSLRTITFSPAPTTIGYQAFIGCSSLRDVSFGGVTSIGDYAFNGCTGLNYVFIGDSVTSIGAYAFANFGLTQIVLPASLTSLGSHAFANCGSPTAFASVYTYGNPPASDGTAFANGYATIFYSPGTSWGSKYNGMATLAYPASFNYSIGASGATITGLLSGFSNLIIPPFVYGSPSNPHVPVVGIGNNAFAGNLTITNVDFPASLLAINDGAFLNCSNLLSAALPASLTSIGTSAFQNCVKLAGINILQGVTNIGANAFAGCPGQTNLEFGAGLAYLGTDAFKGWTHLQTIYFNGNSPINNGSPFVGASGAVLYVLPGSSGWGTTFSGVPVNQWVQYFYNLHTNGLPIGQNNTSVLYGPGSINGDAPFNTSGVTNVEVILQGYAGSQSAVTVPSVISGWPVTTLNRTFYDKRNIGSVVLPNSITNIVGGTFQYCGLTNVVLSTNLLSIGSSAFYGCALQSVVLPDSLTNLESSVFFLSALTNVVLPKHLISVGDYAFSQCPLQSINLPSSLQSIGNHAFDESGLTNVVLPSSLTSIGVRAFFDCPISEKILIPPAVNYIGDQAFFWIRNAPGAIYFEGNAPTSDGTPFFGVSSYGLINGVRYSTGPGVAYYDPSTFGWGTDYSGMKTATWNPYTYTINGGTVTITGYLGSGGALRVPAMIGGFPVTSIGANAFASNSSLIQITLPSSIATLANGAFAGSTNLGAVYFNGNAPAAGLDLFAGDSLLVYRLVSSTGWGSSLSGVNVISYPPTGAITININPSSIGAKWQVDGGTNYYFSGATATNLSVGSHTVNFSTVGGSWLTPNSITLSVAAFQETKFPVPVSYQFLPFSYTTNGDGTLTITGYSGSGGTVYIPGSINGVTVTGIAANAFSNSIVTGVVMPDSITSVGTNAFAGCSNLVSVTVSSGVTNLSGNVFKNCPKLVSVFFNGNAPTTDGTLFTGDGNVSIYYMGGASGWTPSYSGKTASVIPYTFSVLSGNTIRITGYNGPGGDVAIPGRIGGLPVEDIYANVFQNNLSLTNVTIPDSVRSIEFAAFAGCSNLQSVVLGTNLQWIGDLAFRDCASLTNINFPDSLQQIYQEGFQGCGKLRRINLGQGVNWIDDRAFQGCTNLAEVVFGSGLTNIGPGAFSACRALTNLTFPNKLVEIQAGAFGSCTSLTSISFNTNLSIIGNSAFFFCTSLTNVVLPPNIYLGTNAFAFCAQLRTVFFSGMFQFPRSALVDPFYNDPSAVLYYPTAAADVPSRGWLSPDLATSDYASAVAYGMVTGEGGTVVSIDHYAGMNGKNFAIPSTLAGYPVTSIGNDALAGYINNLVIGPGILSLGTQRVTNGNYGINTITVEDGNPNYVVIGGILFDKNQTTLIRCPSFFNTGGGYTVPSTVTNIADFAFAECKLGNITLSPNITRIGEGAFFGAGSLVSVSNPAPDQLTFLGPSAFEGCALTNFTTGNNLASIQLRSFANCSGLKSVALGQAVGSIGAGAFSNCVNLASIDFPTGLVSIGDGAFGNCQTLATLTLPTGVSSGTNYYSLQLGSSVFAGCTGLQTAYFLGNRPNPDYGNTFTGDNQLTVYYLSNSLGWSTTFGGRSAATYAPFGSLQVSYSPNFGAAGWRVDGGALLQTGQSGPAVTNLPVGSHTISFNTLDGYYTPANQVVVVNNLSRTTASANYVQTPVIYTVNSGSITITGFHELNADGFLVVPSSINGVPVTQIGDGAFANNQSLIGVILPSTVTKIGAVSFLNCKNLSQVVLDTNLLSIGTSAFQGCSSLRSVEIPDSVTNISGAFPNCAGLSSVQIGKGITTLSYDTFISDHALGILFFTGAPPTDVNSLKSYYPDLTTLYYNTAAAGWNTVSIATPTDWASLFTYVTNNSGGITITGKNGNYYYDSVIIPSSIGGLPVTTIGDDAFHYNGQQIIMLPSTVSSLGANAFNSGSLKYMFIGSAVTNIGHAAFGSSGNLSGLFVHPSNPVYSSAGGILYNKLQTELIACGDGFGQNNSGTLRQLTVPNGVLAIDDFALAGLNYVSRINLPASLATIGEEALSSSYNLTNITVDPANASFTTARDTLFNKSATVLIQYFGRAPQYIISPGVRSIGSGAFSFNYWLSSVLIPPSVINIGADAFSGSTVNSLTVPNSVTNIGDGAFAYCILTNLVLPTGLTSINARLCLQCQNLTSIGIPVGVTNIGDQAFSDSGLTQIQLPTGLVHLGRDSFAGSHLASIIIPDNVTEVGYEAFASCNYLTSVTLGAGVTNIGSGAFSYDPALQSVTFNDKLASISSNAFLNCSSLGDLVFPASLAQMGIDSFLNANVSVFFLGDAPATDGQVARGGTIYYSSGKAGWGGPFGGIGNTIDYLSELSYAINDDGTLTIVGCDSSRGDLRLPSKVNGSKVTGIASGVFNWQSFNSVTIPAGLTNIAADAFSRCSVLNFIVDGGNPACATVEGSLYNATRTSLLAPANSPAFNLPSTVTNITASMFDSCYALTNFSVDGVNPLFSAVGGVLFDKTSSVLIHYPPGAIAGSYLVPESVSTIGVNAFGGSSLGAIRVPASVTNIQSYAMANSYSLRGVYFEGEAPYFEATALSNDNNVILFHLPQTSADGFLSAGPTVQEWLSLFNWETNRGTSITIVGYNNPGNHNYVLFPKEGIGGLPIKEIGTAFAGGGSGGGLGARLKGIRLPDEVTEIPDGAFANSRLSEVIMSTNVTRIGSNAFEGCNLESINIPSEVSYIGDMAFAGNSLSQVVIPAGVKVLGSGVFSDNQLSEVSLTNGLRSMGDHAFANNYLQQIYIPNSVTNIGASAFEDNSLTNAVITGSILDIKSSTFANNALESISLPAGLLHIEDSAFAGSQLRTLTLPEGLLSIGEGAFYGNSVQTIIIPNGVTNIGAHAFAGNNASFLELPGTLISIGDSAFNNNYLTILVIPASVTSIGDSAFSDNYYINAAYFLGSAPANDNGTALLNNDDPKVHYFAGTTGWGSEYGGVPTALLSQPASVLNNGDNTLTLSKYFGAGSVVLPSAVGGLPITVIGTGAFAASGRALNSITLQNGISTISFEAFRGCPALTTIFIPASVTILDIDAFAGCPGLTNIIVSPGNPFFSSVDGVLFDKNQTTLLACGGGVTGNYLVPAGVTVIGTDAFMGCSGLTNVVLPFGLTSIGDPAFAFCDGLRSVTIPSTVTDLGAYCFAYCRNLTSVYFEGDAPPDDGTAFQGDVNTTVYYRSLAFGFGSTFGGLRAVPLRAPTAAPITINLPIGSSVEIPTSSLVGFWTDPNNAYPVTLQSVGNGSTNLGSILYDYTNNVADRINYTIVDSHGMIGLGSINIIPTGIGLINSGLRNVSLAWLGPLMTNDLATAFADAKYAGGELTYSVVSNSNPSLVSTVVSGRLLTLAPLYNKNGAAQITVRATNPLGLYADSTFTVTVHGVLLATNVSAQRVGTNSVKVSIGKLLSTATVPGVGDAASLASFDITTSQGGSIISSAGSLIYTPPANTNSDSFTYTISDAHGETAVGTILISFRPDTAISDNQPRLTVTSSMRRLRFNGIPGQHYEVQAANSVTDPWFVLSGILTAGPNGVISFDDTEMPPPEMRIYRLVAKP